MDKANKNINAHLVRIRQTAFWKPQTTTCCTRGNLCAYGSEAGVVFHPCCTQPISRNEKKKLRHQALQRDPLYPGAAWGSSRLQGAEFTRGDVCRDVPLWGLSTAQGGRGGCECMPEALQAYIYNHQEPLEPCLKPTGGSLYIRHT